MDLVYFAILCSALIFVHELGHFVWAKIFGVKVLTFSIGFGPKILRIRGRETEYCVGLLPLGGFVKMLEETRQGEVLPEDRSRTFEAQALWKRIIIVLAGPVMNVIFPVLLYFSIALGEGDRTPPMIGEVMPGHPAEGKLVPGDRVLAINGHAIYTFGELKQTVEKSVGKDLTFTVFRGRERVEVSIVPTEKKVEKPLDIVDTVGEIGVGPSLPAAVIAVPVAQSPAGRAGLRTFDVIIDVGGKPIRTFEDFEAALADNHGNVQKIGYLRPVHVAGAMGKMADLSVYDSGVASFTPDVGQGTFFQRTGIEIADLYVADVVQGSAEWSAGLRSGDRIVSVDNTEVSAWSMFEDKLFANPDLRHAIAWDRQGQRKTGIIELRKELWVDEYGQERLRYPPLRASNWLPVVPEQQVSSPRAVWHAFTDAVDKTYDVIRFILIGILRIIQGKVSLSTLGGPITVYDVVAAESSKGVSYFIWAMAVISVNLGLINLLPIPVLDGGHLVFFACEAVARRPLPLRVREVASLLGMLVLVGLMGIAFKNDVERRWDVIQGQVKELVPK